MRQGRYLLARRQTSPELLREAIRKSVAGRQVDARWLDWDGEAWVGVAIRLDEPLGSGKVYTFLPMEEPSPLAAHVHAPFFTKLARREFGLDVPLNSYLMGEIAATCLGLLRVLRDTGDHATVAPLVVDLAAWRPPQHRFLVQACADAGSTLATEQLVPVAGQAEWSSSRRRVRLADATEATLRRDRRGSGSPGPSDPRSGSGGRPAEPLAHPAHRGPRDRDGGHG